MRRIAVLLAAMSAAATPRSEADDDWIELRSDHFVVVSDAGKGRARSVLRELEEIRRLVGTMNPGQTLDGAKPARVVLFENEKSMQPVQPVRNGQREEWAAMFRQTRLEDFLILRVDRDRDYLRELTYGQYMSLVHSYDETRYPLWLRNGLSLFFANARISKKHAEIGKMHRRHRRALGEFRGLPMAEIFAVGYDSPYYRGDGRSLFDAESWALVHYLLIGRERGQGELQAFMNGVANGVAPLAAFESALGMPARTIDEEVALYIRKQVSQYLKVPLEPLDFDDDIEPRELSMPEVDALFGHLHLATRDPAAARERLDAAASATPSSVDVNLGLALLAIEEGQSERAREALETALAGGADNLFVPYLLASEILGTHPGELTVDERSRVRSLLATTLNVDPAHHDSARLYGFTSLFDGERLNDGIQVINRALEVHRGDTNLLLILGQLFTAKGQLEDGKSIFEVLAERQLDPSTAAFVSQQLAYVESRIAAERR